MSKCYLKPLRRTSDNISGTVEGAVATYKLSSEANISEGYIVDKGLNKRRMCLMKGLARSLVD